MSNLTKCISEIWNDNYIIPLYQRNFAWKEQHIQQLLQDIYDNSKDPNSKYYIGSLVVLERFDGVFEVIDGQQRLTTLQIICKSLGLLNRSHLTYDSRPEVEDFFDGLFLSASSKDYYRQCQKRDCRKTYRLVEAIDIVENTEIHINAENGGIKSLSSMTDREKSAFGNYVNNNVVIVQIILPSDTDVSAYFEIMNNRGEQLQEHEIVKALMMRKLGQRERLVFSKVWDACSQMEIPIQVGLKEYLKDNDFPLFGHDYNTLNLDFLDHYSELDKTKKHMTIGEILELNDCSIDEENATNVVLPANCSPIIDFPIFLMNVFKLIDDKCQLNDNLLLSTYTKIETDFNPMYFIKLLLKTRVMFDRYIIKSQGDNDEDENLKWVMLKPYLYSFNNEKKLRFRNTFSKGTEEVSENDIEENTQKRIIMQESMLQVTFRSKKYKNWLFDLLHWLLNENNLSTDPEKISHFLDQWMNEYYNEIERKSATNDHTEWAFKALGTNTPHFVFNFIDYLYWVCHSTNYSIEYLKEIDDFYFKYYNSIEHHLPQSYENIDANIDNIANLCLISRSKNSSLNDKAPREKAKIESGLQPKRKIMYRMTLDDGEWGKSEIDKHYNDLRVLLDSRIDILKLK